jgi:hypothetical protein
MAREKQVAHLNELGNEYGSSFNILLCPLAASLTNIFTSRALSWCLPVRFSLGTQMHGVSDPEQHRYINHTHGCWLYSLMEGHSVSLLTPQDAVRYIPCISL